MVLEENYRLSNGLEIPKLGLGTWFISDEKVAQAVKEAVALGYRHIDTAQAYQNERGVGEEVKIAGANREELFITTKLAAEIKNYRQALDAIDGSLEKMGLDYIDLLIIHSPKPWSAFLKREPNSSSGFGSIFPNWVSSAKQRASLELFTSPAWG